MSLDEKNSGIGQGRAKSYMEGFLDKLMKARPERVGEGSTIIGKLTKVTKSLVLFSLYLFRR